MPCMYRRALGRHSGKVNSLGHTHLRTRFSISRAIAIAISLALHVGLLLFLNRAVLPCTSPAGVARLDHHARIIVYVYRRPQATHLLRSRRPRLSRNAHAEPQRLVVMRHPVRPRTWAHSQHAATALDLRLPSPPVAAWSQGTFAINRTLSGDSLLVGHRRRFRFRSTRSAGLLGTALGLARGNACGLLAAVLHEAPQQRLSMGMTRHMIGLAKRAYNCD